MHYICILLDISDISDIFDYTCITDAIYIYIYMYIYICIATHTHAHTHTHTHTTVCMYCNVFVYGNIFVYSNVFVYGNNTPVLNLRRYASFMLILWWSLSRPVNVECTAFRITTRSRSQDSIYNVPDDHQVTESMPDIRRSGWPQGYGAEARRDRKLLENVTLGTTASENFPDACGRRSV